MYHPPGRCIYCPETKGLEREHILPHALGGNLIFRAASCKTCAKTINEHVENPILQAMLGNLRARLGLHELRKRGPRKTKSDSRNLRFVKQITQTAPIEETHTASVKNDDIPIIVVGFILDPPTLLTGAARNDSEVDMWTKVETGAFRTLTKEDGVSFQAARVNPLVFFRMLAKIAHGVTAVQVGLCNFTPLLPEFILGRSTAYSHLIGGPGRILESDQAGGHRIKRYVSVSHVDGKRYHTVNIRLFLPFDPPEYDVIVGECR